MRLLLPRCICFLFLTVSVPDLSILVVKAEVPGQTVVAQDEPTAAGAQSVSPATNSAVEEHAAGGDDGPTGSPLSVDPAPDLSTGSIQGTVTDVYGDLVPGSTVAVEGTGSERRTTVADDSGAFHFDNLKPGIAYRITISANGFADWKSPEVILRPGQFFILQGIKLKLLSAATSVTVYATPEQIATQQVVIEEHQRVLGIIPNFYVTYDKQPVPLTTKLKFRLAFKADTDVVTFFGVAFLAAIYQAGDIPNYGQGWDAYGKRVAAGYADTTTDIFLGGAIFPWLLHQDPRYFYQGTGTKKARLRHALFSPFVCKGDNGKTQANYSSMGGDLVSGAISNFYYPESNRGAGLVFQGFAVTTGVRMVNGILQEFLLRKLTPSARSKK